GALGRAAANHGIGAQRKPRIYAAHPIDFGKPIGRAGEYFGSVALEYGALLQVGVRGVSADVTIEVAVPGNLIGSRGVVPGGPAGRRHHTVVVGGILREAEPALAHAIHALRAQG